MNILPRDGSVLREHYRPSDRRRHCDVLLYVESAEPAPSIAALGSNPGRALGPLLAATVLAFFGGYLGIWLAALVLVTAATDVILSLKKA